MFTSKKIVFMALFVALLSTSIYSQEVGQIFDKKEATKKFGSVLEKITINSDELKSILLSTDDKVMFMFENSNYTILGDQRKLLYGSNKYVESNQVFHLFSKTKVLELLNKGSEQTVILENRENFFTITVGNYTLEMSMPCPPFCE